GCAAFPGPRRLRSAPRRDQVLDDLLTRGERDLVKSDVVAPGDAERRMGEKGDSRPRAAVVPDLAVCLSIAVRRPGITSQAVVQGDVEPETGLRPGPFPEDGGGT